MVQELDPDVADAKKLTHEVVNPAPFLTSNPYHLTPDLTWNDERRTLEQTETPNRWRGAWHD